MPINLPNLAPYLQGLAQPQPNYQYTHGSASLQPDYANMRAQIAQNIFSGQLGPAAARGPIQAYNAAHTVGHTPLFGRIGNAVSNFGSNTAGALKNAPAGVGALAGGAGNWFQHYLGTPEGRRQLATIGLIAAGGYAAGGGFGGGGATAAGVGAHGGADIFGAALAPGAATAGGIGATIDPWAGLYSGTASSTFPTIAGAGGVAGGAAPALAGTGATAAAGTTPWYNTFLGQAGINTGANLLGGFLQNRAISQAQNASNQQIQDRIRQALAALSPEQIMALAQRFLPQMAANMNVAGQTAVQAVREQAARTGQLEGPRALSFEAGTRAKLASDVQQRAFEAAINNAAAQVSAITGAPYTPIQPQLGYADAITNSINQAYLARALSQQPQYSPYRWPGQGFGYGWSAPGVPNWGG